MGNITREGSGNGNQKDQGMEVHIYEEMFQQLELFALEKMESKSRDGE